MEAELRSMRRPSGESRLIGMPFNFQNPNRKALSICLFVVFLGCAACAQVSIGHMLDETAAPGANYDKAEFRLWYPDNARFLRAVLVLVPGSNADGRPDVGDRFWQAFASRNDVVLIGCRFTDKPHDEAFIENYANAAQGSGQALLDALTAFSRRSDHPELANAPLLLWGMSTGGEFNYEFTAWKPERVVAFVVNKGGIYFSALLPEAARHVPGLLFVGEEDLDALIRIKRRRAWFPRIPAFCLPYAYRGRRSYC